MITVYSALPPNSQKKLESSFFFSVGSVSASLKRDTRGIFGVDWRKAQRETSRAGFESPMLHRLGHHITHGGETCLLSNGGNEDLNRRLTKLLAKLYNKVAFFLKYLNKENNMKSKKFTVPVIDSLNSEKRRITAEVLRDEDGVVLKIGSLMLPVLGLASVRGIRKELQEKGTVCLTRADAYNEGLHCGFSLYFTGVTFYVVLNRDYPSGRVETSEVYHVYPSHMTGNEVVADFEDSLARMFEREIDTLRYSLEALW